MNHVIEHDLDHDTAKLAINQAYKSYAQQYSQYSPTMEWTSDNTVTMGFKVMKAAINGTIMMRPGAIRVDMKVPLLLRGFKVRAVAVVEKEIRSWLEKARTGQLTA